MSWYNPNRPGSGKGKGASRRPGKGEPFFRPRAPKALPGAKPAEEHTAAPPNPSAPAGPPPADNRPAPPRPPDEPERGEFR